MSLVGFGTDEPMLRDLIRDLDLEKQVTLEHHPDSPAFPLSRSDVFLSGARWEGWSLAICEALRFGLPVVSFNCEFGPSDIIVDDKIGRLVAMDDIGSFVETMVYYYDDIEGERQHADYRARYIDKFSVETVVQVHAEALLSAVSPRPALPVTS